MMTQRDLPKALERMVREEVEKKGVTDPRVLAAMRAVLRHRFVPRALSAEAYTGAALPIGSGQTISAPQIVGLMTQALSLTGEECVLEVGTGSGYQAAILAQLAHRVVTIERIPELARRAQRLFRELGLDGVVVKEGDGSEGCAAAAPFDRIIVTAAAPEVPETLLAQLVDHGILVAPIGDRTEQTLKRFTKDGDKLHEVWVCRCVFVPLLGREGFKED